MLFSGTSTYVDGTTEQEDLGIAKAEDEDKAPVSVRNMMIKQ